MFSMYKRYITNGTVMSTRCTSRDTKTNCGAPSDGAPSVDCQHITKLPNVENKRVGRLNDLYW